MNLDLSVKGVVGCGKRRVGGNERKVCGDGEKGSNMGYIICKSGLSPGIWLASTIPWRRRYSGNQARSHYPTLYCVKAHVVNMGNKKYKRKLKSILSQAGWTRKVLDDENKVLKKKFDLNSYAHPTVSIEKHRSGQRGFL